MTGRWLLVLGVLGAGLAAGASERMTIRIETDAEVVALGEPFAVRIVRVWDAELRALPFDDASLAPLVLRLEETSRREQEGRIEQTRRYRARAFALGEVAVPAPTLEARPRSGGPVRAVTGRELRLRVTGTLDPEAPGRPELPGDPLPLPERDAPGLPWWVAAVAALAAAVLVAAGLALRRGWTTPSAEPEEPRPAPPGPHELALARLARLRERDPRDREAMQAYYSEAYALMREYTGERFGVRVRERTSEEILADLEEGAVLALPPHERLARYLAHCDRVRFGREMPGAADREQVLESAERFVRETRPAEPRGPDRASPARNGTS